MIGRQDERNEGTFGLLSATCLPTDSLSISLTHDFRPDSDGTTQSGVDKCFLAGNSSMSLFANAGYVHDSDSWDAAFGLQICFGDTRRAEVSRGVGRGLAGRGLRGINTTQLFFNAASRQTQAYNDSLVA